MFDKDELEQAQYYLAQHYLARLKSYSDLYKTKNQGDIAAHQFEADKSQIEHSLNWAANAPTDEATELYLALIEGGSALFVDHQSFEKRLAQQKTALELARQLKRTEFTAINLFRLGTLHRDLAKYKEARNYLEEALIQALDLETYWLIADCYNELGIVAKRLGHQEEAWGLTHQALTTAREMNSDLRVAKFSRSLSTIAYEMGKLEIAIELARESIAIFEVIGSPREIAQVAYTLGSLLLMTPETQLEEAREFLWQSYNLFNQIGNKRMLASVACNIASDLIKNQEDYAPAIQLTQDALETYWNMNYSLGICNALTILGEAAFKQDEFERARKLYSEGLAIAKETQSAWDIIMLSVGIGMVSNAIHNYEDARQYLLEALEVAVDGHMEALTLLTLVQLIVPMAYQEEQVERAVEHLGMVLEHPMTNAVVMKEAQTILAQLQVDFPLQDVNQMLERGKQTDLQKVVEELLNRC